MLFRSNDTATTQIYTVTNTLSLHDALPIHRFLERLERQTSLDDLDRCFPFQVLSLEASALEFYQFYGV